VGLALGLHLFVTDQLADASLDLPADLFAFTFYACAGVAHARHQARRVPLDIWQM
jgi:hypothetical protein